MFMLPYRKLIKLEESDYPLHLTYVFEWKKHPLDSTNVSYMVKMLEDAFVDNQMMTEDDIKYVRRTTMESILNPSIDKDTVTITFEKYS